MKLLSHCIDKGLSSGLILWKSDLGWFCHVRRKIRLRV